MAPNIIFLGKRVVPLKRIDKPHSPSSETNKGTLEASCIRFVNWACTSGLPLWNKTPPIFSSFTYRNRRCIFWFVVFTSAITMNNCPIRSSILKVLNTESVQAIIFCWSTCVSKVGLSAAKPVITESHPNISNTIRFISRLSITLKVTRIKCKCNENRLQS